MNCEECRIKKELERKARFWWKVACVQAFVASFTLTFVISLLARILMTK